MSKFIIIPKEEKAVTMTIRIDRTLQEKYNQLSNETNHSRNELISMALQYALDNMEIKKEEGYKKGPSVQRGPLLSLLERSVFKLLPLLEQQQELPVFFSL